MRAALTALLFALGAGAASAADLTVTVQGVRSANGHVEMSLYRQDGNWPEGAPSQHLVLEAVSGTLTATFKDVPPGRYAVSGFHDENDSHTFDTNFVGLPREGFLFSRDARPHLTAPDFEVCAFDIGADPLALTVHFQYWRSTRAR